MLTYPNIDPVAISLGPLKVHWYGLCYLAAFALAFFLGRRRAGRSPWESWTVKQVEDFIFWSVLGVLIGGRLGYVLFYQFPFYLANPLAIFQIWQGGMSFHGGLIGVIITLALWSRKHKRGFFETTDFCAPLTPLGLAVGRLGNFINGELVGRPTDLPWGMVFRHIDPLPRHPSQLYEFALEGLLFFALMWWLSSTRRPIGMISGAFLAFYGVIRFCVEFTREPDAQLGFLAGGITMGQWLSLPMMIIGVGIMVWAERGRI